MTISKKESVSKNPLLNKAISKITKSISKMVKLNGKPSGEPNGKCDRNDSQAKTSRHNLSVRECDRQGYYGTNGVRYVV